MDHELINNIHTTLCAVFDHSQGRVFKLYFFYDKYNWIPSHPGFEFNTLNKSVLNRKFDLDEDLPGYIDLRNNFPQIEIICKASKKLAKQRPVS